MIHAHVEVVRSIRHVAVEISNCNGLYDFERDNYYLTFIEPILSDV